MSTRYRLLQELFEQTRCVPAAERDAHLRRACPDDAALRDEVLALLRADAETGLLDRDAAGALEVTEEARTTEHPRVAHYRLVDRIASGGMGDVYRAHQLAPVQRTVAIKVLRAGLSEGSFPQRFEDERQLVARMQHTGIAQLFESGMTADGSPFFAMELVEGEPITRFCDAHGLPLHDRLDLFASVCDAVHYAHGQGVVHRDIKPANVLTKLQDGRPIAKIIDFGIAHADDLAARPRAILGTPGYVSPERHRGEVDGPAADVYSLGVLLFELVVGTQPGDGGDRCSDALRRLPAAAAAAAASARGLSLPALERECRRDLDWIATRAVAHRAEDRYPTARALADDLRRYIAARPILARPRTIGYRLQRQWRRSRATMTAAGVAVLSLLVAAAIGLSGWLDRRHAQESVDKASRLLVERSIDESLANLPGSDPVRLELLQSGLELSTRALREAPSDPALQERVHQARRAWARQMVRLGRLDQAIEGFRSALADDVRDAPERLRVQAHLSLASTLRHAGRLEEAEQVTAELLRTFPVRREDPWARRAVGASAWREHALNARRAGAPARALAAARKALAWIEDPDESVPRWQLLWKRVDLHKVAAELSAELPDEPYAAHFEEALASVLALRRDYQRTKLVHLTALIYDSWSFADVQHRRFDEIDERDLRALAELEPLLEQFPERVPYQETWLRIQRRRARAAVGRQAARERYDTALLRGRAWLDASSQNPALSRMVDLLQRERDRLD